MILQTSRLTLRPLKATDAEAVHAMMADLEVMAYSDVPKVEDIELTRLILQGQLKAANKGLARHWAMMADAGQASDAFIGCCQLNDIDRWHHRAEIGFILDRRYWGRGYALEAMQAVVNHAAQNLHLRRLTARVHLGNVRSVRLLERLGFEEEGVLRGFVARDGERRDVQLFGLLL